MLHKFVHPPCGQASATSLTNQSPLEMCLARPLTQGPPTASTRASKQSESDNATKLFYACLKIPLYPNMAMEDHGTNHDLPKFYEIPITKLIHSSPSVAATAGDQRLQPALQQLHRARRADGFAAGCCPCSAAGRSCLPWDAQHIRCRSPKNRFNGVQ